MSVIAAFGAVRDVSRGLKLCSAARYHSWCARYSDRSVVTECAFDTHAQCLATRRRRRLVPEMRFERSLAYGLLREVSKVSRGLSLLGRHFSCPLSAFDNNPV